MGSTTVFIWVLIIGGCVLSLIIGLCILVDAYAQLSKYTTFWWLTKFILALTCGTLILIIAFAKGKEKKE
ncbi:MAG: hypothetical protein LBV22_01505 [Mycoplasmataceae bacterium]|nr:hypothetical protein [Mycoplasmataceae bacterium]